MIKPHFGNLVEVAQENLLRSLPWILAVVGSACIIAGYLLVDPITHKTLQDILTSFGQAILVAGVFGAVLKSFQFIGVFREALFDIVFENRFLNMRKDLPALWERVTTSMCKQKFPELSDKLHRAILKDYLPVDKNFYYSKYHRICHVDWQERTSRTLRMVEELHITIVPTDSHESIEYRFKFSPTEGVSLNLNHPEVEELTINGRDYTNEGRPEGNAYVYRIPLKEASKYDVYRRIVRVWPVDLDPYSTYVTPNFVSDAHIKVESIPSDLRVRFVPLGTLSDFEKRGAKVGHIARAGDIDREYKELLFPRQGYILFFQVVEQAGASVYPDGQSGRSETEPGALERTKVPSATGDAASAQASR